MDAQIPLLQRQSLSREILDQIPIIVIVADVRGEIIYANPAVEAILGYRPDEVLGDGWWKQTRSASRDPEVEKEQIGRWIREGSHDGQPYEREVPDRWGGERTIVWRDVLGPDGTLIGYGQDITGQRRFEASLLAARQVAETASRAKTDFLANMSHELRTPMNAVTGASSLLLDTSLDAQQKELVEIVRGSSQSLLGLVDDILDFSRIETGSLELERAPFDLWQCAEDALGAVAYQASAKGLDVGLELTRGVPRRVIGDALRLRQVLVNLLANAVKFTRRGTISVRLGLDGGDRRGSADESITLRVVVEDTGIGIPPQRRDKIFDSFSQVDTSTSRQYGGAGLGLAIARRLVEMMGGSIEVDSDLGRGSTFTFSVRLQRRRADPGGDGMRAVARAIDGCSVGLVGLGTASAKALGGLLESWGADVALLEASSRPPSRDAADLVFVQLETVDEAIFERWLESPTTVLALTSMLDASMAARSERAAARLVAPIRPTEVVKALRLVFELTETVTPLRPRAGEGDVADLRVLLAEDNPVNQMIALMMLERLGLEAEVAANGLQVMEAITRRPYDVILMDVQMPELDGLETTRQIRRTLRSAVQVIAVTANATAGDRERCLEAGMDGYLSKPFQLDVLRRTLSECRRLDDAEVLRYAAADGDPEKPRPRCPFIDRCPMFPLFENEPIRRVYQLAYCTADFEACQRYHLASQGTMPDPRLLPDGGVLPVDAGPRSGGG